MCGLAALSDPLVEVVLGEKWHYTATLMVPLCFCMMWYPIHAINLDLLKVKGRSDLFLRLEIVKKILGATMLIITIPFGLLTMCYGTIINSIISLTLNTYYIGKLIVVGLWMQMRDLVVSLLMSLSLFVIVLFINKIVDNNYLKLFLGGIVGIGYYFSVSILAKPEEYKFLKSLIKI